MLSIFRGTLIRRRFNFDLLSHQTNKRRIYDFKGKYRYCFIIKVHFLQPSFYIKGIKLFYFPNILRAQPLINLNLMYIYKVPYSDFVKFKDTMICYSSNSSEHYSINARLNTWNRYLKIASYVKGKENLLQNLLSVFQSRVLWQH